MKPNNPLYIVVHHSATDDDIYSNDLEKFRRFHTAYVIDGHIVTKEEFVRRQVEGDGSWFKTPWADIGYHYVIERVADENGKPKLVMEPGRDTKHVGVHAIGTAMDQNNVYRPINHLSIGVCVAGNFDKYPPDREKWHFIGEQIGGLCYRFGIPILHIKPHSFFQPEKTCPGNMFDMNGLRDLCSFHYRRRQRLSTVHPSINWRSTL